MVIDITQRNMCVLKRDIRNDKVIDHPNVMVHTYCLSGGVACTVLQVLGLLVV